MSQLRKTVSTNFILPIQAEVKPILEELLYVEDILYRRLIMQLIFDLILNDKIISGKYQNYVWIIEKEIRSFLSAYPRAKLHDVTTDELIQSAEELYIGFYRHYRHHLRSSFETAPRIDHYEIRPFGIHFKVTLFSTEADYASTPHDNYL